jgi:uncharacterized protein YbjT (DUF2867 family)
MEKQIVTVFGGSGFIGRHLVHRLVKAGATVRVACRDTEAALFMKPMGDVGQVVLVKADIKSDESVANAVKGAQTVVNLVGLLAESGKQSFENIHTASAERIAKAAAAAGARNMIQISAVGADAKSDSLYARTKAAGEKAVKSAFKGAVIVRPSIVFGPEDGFFNLFSSIARLSPVLPVFGCPAFPKLSLFSDKGLAHIDLYGDGGTKFQPVYVGDVADAIVASIDNDEARGGTFELGGPAVYSSVALMQLLLKTIDRKRWLLPIPFWVLMIEGWFLGLLPKPLLTVDQVKLLKTDNVVGKRAKKLSNLGIQPTAAEAVLPTYLARFRLPSHGTVSTTT